MSAATQLARHYDEKYAAERTGDAERVVAAHPRPRDRYEACLQHLPRFLTGGHVLEVGAGSGLVARSLAAAGANFSRYTATEFSGARLEGLRASLRDPRFEVAELDLAHPGAEHRGRYDAVILLALVEHLVDPLRALGEVRAMLRPGGVAYIDTPNIAKLSRRLKLLAGRFPSTASRDEGLATWAGQPVDLHDEGHLHYFTYRSLTRLLVERCGFARVTPTPYVTPPWPLGRRAHARLAQLRPQLFAELCLVAHA